MSVMSTHHDACKHGANLKKLSVGEDRAGLSIVPVVPWEGASAASPPPDELPFLPRCVNVR